MSVIKVSQIQSTGGTTRFNTETASLEVANITASGIVTATDFNTTSDENLKTDVQLIEDSVDKILKIDGVKFNWKETKKPSIGVIAQNIEKVFPELVSNNNNIKNVNYNGLIGVLIEVVKDQQKKIEHLNARLDKLESN